MLALMKIARRISSASASGVMCSARKRPPLVSLPTFGDTASESGHTVLNESVSPSSDAHSFILDNNTPAGDTSSDVDLNSQCYVPSDQWQHMDKRFFSERVPLELLGNGLVGEVWYEQARDSMGIVQPIVTKIYDYQSPSGTTGLHLELFLYSSWDHLRPLQGKHVPRVIGAFSVPGGRMSLAMEPPSRSGWREASLSDTDEVKEKIIQAYNAIHSQGVLHNDVELRHILISDEGAVQIIDWQMAKSTKPCDAVQLQVCTQADLEYEARKVKVLLDYQGAYARELELVAHLVDSNGGFTELADSRLEWFSFYEINLMISGEWTEPDPEYTGGRPTRAPSVTYGYAGPSDLWDATWSKSQCGNYAQEGSGRLVVSASTTTAPVPNSNTLTSSVGDVPHPHFTPKMDTNFDFPPSPWGPGIKGVAPRASDMLDAPDTPKKTPKIRSDAQRFFVFFNRKDLIEPKPPVGEGSPSGRDQWPRPCLRPRSWFMPPQRPLQNYPKPQRPNSVQKPRVLHRCTLWMHAQYESLPSSPLNDTTSRAAMPTRPKPSLEGAPVPETMHQSTRPANALRPFGSILPGSTLESFQLSTPPPRNSQGQHILEEPNFLPLPLFQPLPLARKRFRATLTELALEMSYARRYSNSTEMRSQQIKDLNRVVKDVKNAKETPTQATLERWESAIKAADMERLHSRKVFLRGGPHQRLEHTRTLTTIVGTLRSLISKLQQSSSDGNETTPLDGTHRPARRPFASLGNDTDTTTTTTTAQPARAPRFSDAAFENLQSIALALSLRGPAPPEPKPVRPSVRRAMRAIESSQASTSAGPSTSGDAGVSSVETDYPSAIASTSQTSVPNTPLPGDSPAPSMVECPTVPSGPPKSPIQCRRARAPYPGPSTRILRSRSKQGVSEPASSSAALAGTSQRNRAGAAVARTPSARNDTSKAKRTRTTRNKTTPSTLEQPTPTQSHYNLRPRKRELGEDEGKSQAGNTGQTGHPTKRRRA